MHKGWRGHSREHAMAARGIPSRWGPKPITLPGPVVGSTIGYLEKQLVEDGLEVVSGHDSLRVVYPDGNSINMGFGQMEDGIAITWITATKKGMGRGTHIIGMLKEYAGENDIELYAKYVDNPEFWEKQGFYLYDDENWVYRWEGL